MGKDPKLIVVSNRLPVEVVRTEDGLKYHPAAGGLATSLQSVRKQRDMVWLGWPGIHVWDDKERKEIERRLLKEYESVPLFLPPSDFDLYYEGFSNGTIWPLFHYFPQNAHYEAREWSAYKAINALFRDKILEIARPGDLLWIHDYHLMMLPELVREALPEAKIGFFLHIPFPSSELFRMLPWREEILRGLLGSDLIGFHSHGYARHFLSSLLRLLGLEQEFGRVITGDRVVKVDTFPIGVDVGRFETAMGTKAVQKELADLEDQTRDRKIVLTVDRLDFTKGIVERLESFDHFLSENPDWHRRVTLISLAVPSRTGVPEYQALKKEVDEAVGRINGRYGRPGWVPIWYMYRFLPFDRLVALYGAADVALVTPLRDGMNLVAKEYLAAHPDGTGVLILSETAGAAEELGEALIVNPHDTEEISEALLHALTMSESEQMARNLPMLARLRRYDVVRWAEDFLGGLEPEIAPAKQQVQVRLDEAGLELLLEVYRSTNRRLLLLDYDGTMVPFAARPEEAAPDEELITLLVRLVKDKKNTVVIISGRDLETLQDWLGEIGADLVAEHGAQIRRPGDTKWTRQTTEAPDGWKGELRPLLELYVDRTPGSMLEEKTASMAWHYRRAEPDLGDLRAKQLMENLEGVIANTPLVIMQGSKVVEVKESGIGKGRAALRWLDSDTIYDFILATGDDVTDEEMFEVMPDGAWSIRIGVDRRSAAKYSLRGTSAFRSMLRSLVGD
ncbi:MAG: bifunctional alpha,alpha-trehalose-phosphate synthase (UDP-forming)/trehalose-phosphatase [Chloroflexi bacterium]|nr:bifunctional alpha,alpha-trehalose-phosphate synthase (UDP-forming)/trehalose-phosphatase [Chloroflexota bacterium]